jgi:hypothetical protein
MRGPDLVVLGWIRAAELELNEAAIAVDEKENYRTSIRLTVAIGYLQEALKLTR